MPNVFENYKAEEHPPYEQWILKEAGGNLELADLIERREINYDDASDRGGARALEEGEFEHYMTIHDDLHALISEKKEQLGLINRNW